MEASIYRCPIKPRSARAGCAGRGEGGEERRGKENQRVKLRERKDAPKESDPFLARSTLLPLGGDYDLAAGVQDCTVTSLFLGIPNFFFFFYHYVL